MIYFSKEEEGFITLSRNSPRSDLAHYSQVTFFFLEPSLSFLFFCFLRGGVGNLNIWVLGEQ